MTLYPSELAQGRTQHQHTHGFTIIELLITLSILSILFSVAIPRAHHFVERSRASASINQIAGLLRFARNEAVSHGTTTTLCPSLNGVECQRNEWHQGLIMFRDHNSNGKLDPDETLSRYQTPFLRSGSLKWRSIRNKIQFNSRGMVRGTAGSFVYCPENNDVKLAESLVVSFQGRVRRGLDTNQDGIKETGSHKNIEC